MTLTKQQLKAFHRRQANITGRHVEWHYEDKRPGRRPVYDQYGRPYRSRPSRPYVGQRHADKRARDSVLLALVIAIILLCAELAGHRTGQ
jgi:hypothetical protein